MLTAMRKTIAVGRYAEKLNRLKGHQIKNPVGTVIILELGNACKVAGTGDMFKNFIKCKQISGFSGQDSNFSSIGDEGYDDSPLQIIRFDQTFRRSSYDARRGNRYMISSDIIMEK